MESFLQLSSISCPKSLFQFLFLILFLKSCQANRGHTGLVYNSCAHNITADPSDSHISTLSSFFQHLVTQSSKSKFFKTTVAGDHTGISGFFQCRGDLSVNACNDCVRKIPDMSKSLCSESVAARIQLSGCYAHYETDENPESASKYELLHKACGEQKAKKGEFIGLIDAAFEALESGIADAENGYYKTYYEKIEVVAQCQEDLDACYCGECVSYAVQIAQDECGLSVSGEVYLKKCFVGYHYYPEGIPKESDSEKQKGNNDSGKTLAIVVGGVAALAFGLIFLLFLKSGPNRDDDF